jgi:hypothetical protein
MKNNGRQDEKMAEISHSVIKMTAENPCPDFLLHEKDYKK